MLFDGAPTTGLMYYVDAFTQKTNSTLADIKGTGVGINNSPTGLWNSWVTVKNGVFDLSDYTITLEMVYQNGYLHLYADGELAHSLYYGAYSSDMHFGIKSFGFGMEVTNYLASDDPEGDGWTDKMVEVEKQNVNTLFLGDSYMEFWKTSGIAEHVAQLPSYANEGVGGTKVNQWTERVAEMAMRYNPENIVFHIGVNDVDDDQVSANVTYTRLMDLFDNYHEVFPQATIYWVSLIPNEMFSGNTTTYNEVNSSVHQYAQENASWLKYIDATTPFTAADGGARHTTTVDLSRPSLEWARRNMARNGFTGREHEFVQADVLAWVSEQRHTRNRWDLIFCDVPTFSNSARMRKASFDVQRDHAELIIGVSRLLVRGGSAIFSCNLRAFRPDVEKLERAGVRLTDITDETIPEDFARNRKIHHAYLMERA